MQPTLADLVLPRGGFSKVVVRLHGRLGLGHVELQCNRSKGAVQEGPMPRSRCGDVAELPTGAVARNLGRQPQRPIVVRHEGKTTAGEIDGAVWTADQSDQYTLRITGVSRET